MNNNYPEVIQVIREAYAKASGTWCLGYSGGKDSTALLILLLNALKDYPENPDCKIRIVYCNTGVEFPLISSLVEKQFFELAQELPLAGIRNVSFSISYPALEDRFFSQVIGKGYVPPSFLFRWCTRRLRVKPLQSVFAKSDTSSTVLLGVRSGESSTRDRVIKNYQIEHYYTKQSEYPKSIVFCPVIDFSVSDVWNVINFSTFPSSIARKELRDLYSSIGTVFSEDGNYVADKKQGRFGCWTCTVVRKDLAMEGLINNGHSELIPLRDFMIWLKTIRDDSSRREKNRTTGKEGKGPFNIETRKEILMKLIEAQTKSGMTLVSAEEIDYINGCFAEASLPHEQKAQ